MKTFARNALALSVLASTSVFAIGPTIGGPSTGLWYNASETGRGYDIDLQGDTMIVTTYVYTASGDPMWYLSSGTFDYATGRFTSSYDSYSDGQCFGCAPHAPTLHSGAAGPMTIVFQDDQHATLSYPGGTTHIVKFNYGFGSPNDTLYGEWAFSYDIAGSVGGDWLIFSAPFVGSDGTVYAAGNEDGDASNVALGTFEASLGEYAVLVEVGGIDHFYTVSLDDHRGVGSAWVFPAGGSPTGNGSAAAAGRLLYKSELTYDNAAPIPAGLSGRRVQQGDATMSPPTATTKSGPEDADSLDAAHASLLARLRTTLAEKRTLPTQ